MSAKETEKMPSPVELTDLRNITRNSDTLRTEVELHFSHSHRIKWLVLGACNLCKSENAHSRVPRWCLDAKMGTATDFEHDPASAVRLPLVAVSIAHVYHNSLDINAVVEPRIDRGYYLDFHVPRPGYNPMEYGAACWCDGDHCQGDDKHIIVPEGLYVPPFDEELYDAVAGCRVEIHIGQVPKETL